MSNKVKEFRKYVSNFDLKDFSIRRKLDHSIRVMKLSKKLSKKIKLKKEDVKLAELIGLLHDYARFPQWTQYKTFNDAESFDHGDLGAKLLFEDMEIELYGLNIDKYEIAKNAIKNHNKFEYSHDINEDSIIHSDVIRDTDKLDIFYIFAKGIIKHENNSSISKNIKEDFFSNKLIKYKDVKNNSDKIILTLSMIYDINYLESIKYLKSKNYIWQFYNRLNDRENLYDYFKYIDNYLEERLMNNVR